MSYTSIFKITIRHFYYTSGNCEDLQYKASADTQALMNKYGIILRQTGTGFEVYTSTNQSVETYLNDITQVSANKAFTFVGIPIDTAFFNFTNIPLDQVGVCTYASNSEANVANDQTVQLVERLTKTTIAHYHYLAVNRDHIVANMYLNI